MAVNEDYLLFIQEQLSKIGDFETKKMFGGVGFFKDGLMFGMIGQGTFRLKVDDANIADYEAKGMKPMFSKDGKSSLPYWEVPAEVYEDMDLLKGWANLSIQVAIKAATKAKSK